MKSEDVCMCVGRWVEGPGGGGPGGGGEGGSGESAPFMV
jgi:hypothetical protein